MKSCEYQQIDPRTLAAPRPPEQRGGADRSTAATRSRRKWEVFPGKNRFYCDGRIILARQSGVLPMTLGLIVVTCGFFFAFDCPFLVEHLTVFIPVIGGVLFVFVIVSLLQTSLTDPGILPRATPDEAADVERQIDTSGSSSYRPPPRTKEIVIREQVVKLKYCFTCKMFRPPRTSHCSLCDNCVERFDHHCPWVGNCVGRRNYRFFYSFIISLSFLTSFIFGCVITHLTLRSQSGRGIVQSIQESPASVVELVICFFSIWSVLGLSGFHTYLVASNLTTNEDIKGSWSSKRGAEHSVNPYSHNSVWANCCVTLCGPMPPSLIDRRGSVPPDDPSVAAAAAPELDLPPFMAKSDTRMSPKDLLERVVHSSDLCLPPDLCPPATPKTTTTPGRGDSAGPPDHPSPSSCSPVAMAPGCWERRPPCPPAAAPCPPRDQGTRRASLHSVNPAFRLASPSPVLGHTPLVAEDAAGPAPIPPH